MTGVDEPDDRLTVIERLRVSRHGQTGFQFGRRRLLLMTDQSVWLISVNELN